MKLAIDIKESLFHNHYFSEIADLDRVNILLNSGNLKINQNGINEYTMLESYKNKIVNGRVDVKYTHSKIAIANSRLCGRVYSEGYSLQNMRKPIRQFLTYGNYVDIDIENCFPVLLEQLCKNNKIKCPNLTKYVENREYYLSTINVDRSIAKNLFLIILHSGTAATPRPFRWVLTRHA